MSNPNRKKSLAAKANDMPKNLAPVEDNRVAEKKAIDGLKAKRNKAFEQLVKNPQDTSLALEIKLVDDQIAECIKQFDRKRKDRA
jgi:hypothetical protein